MELALESSLHKGLTSVEQIRIALSQTGSTKPGRSVLRSLLDQLPGTATESALESIVWRLIVEAGLPLPVRQYEVRDQQGRFVARIDFAYPDVLVAVEADGHTFHSGKRDWARDLARQNALIKLGWIVYRVTWHAATTTPAVVANEISELLKRRRKV